MEVSPVWKFPTFPHQATGLVIRLALLLEMVLTSAAAEGLIHTGAVISAVVSCCTYAQGRVSPLNCPSWAPRNLFDMMRLRLSHPWTTSLN
jgi:hypothetical protein